MPLKMKRTEIHLQDFFFKLQMIRTQKKTLKRPIQQENKQTSLIKLFPQLNPSQTNFVKMSVKHFSSKTIYQYLN